MTGTDELTMWTLYLATWGGLILAQIAPGPNFIAVSGAALGRGFKPAFFMTCGVATATFVWGAATALGLASLVALYPGTLTLLRIIGGGYLTFMGYKGLRSALRASGPSIAPSALALTPAAAWRRGFLINMTNPKSALTWGAITSFLLGSDFSSIHAFGMAPLGAISALGVYITYSFLFSRGLARQLYGRFTRIVDGLFGLAFAIFGCKLLKDGIEEFVRRA